MRLRGGRSMTLDSEASHAKEMAGGTSESRSILWVGGIVIGLVGGVKMEWGRGERVSGRT